MKILILAIIMISIVSIGFSQNPYEKMGNIRGISLKTDEDKAIEDGIYVLHNKDSLHRISFVIFDFKNGIVLSVDNDANIIAIDTIVEDSKAIWLTPDPYNQTNSPYSAMNNNSISNIDPDGGFFQELINWTRGRGWISNQGFKFMENHPGATYNGWQGNRLSGFASIGYKETDGAIGCISFKAVQDIPRFGFYSLWGKNIITTNLFDGSSFTPGNFVISGTYNDYHNLNLVRDRDHYRHEFGHIEQYQMMGVIRYYQEVVIPSVKSFHANPELHDYYHTETSANLLGAMKYGEFDAPALYPKLKYDGPIKMLYK